MSGRLLRAALAVTLLAGCAHAPADDPADPLEPVNRGIFVFNTVLDKGLVKPLAKGYDWVAPDFVRIGISNFFSNLFSPGTILNDFLQGKGRQGAEDSARFILNTILGVGGLFDVAQHVDLLAHDEDFGQTFGHWGVGEGWYLMIPVLGPSSNRDLFGRVGDTFTNPLSYVDEAVALAGNGIYAVERRAQLLGADALIEQQLDAYIFIRSVYLQSRQNAVYDGSPPKEDYGFDEDE